MIANPEKSHVVFLTNNKTNNSVIEIRINDKLIKSERNGKLLGVEIDNKLNLIYM